MHMTPVFIPMMVEFQKYERKLKLHESFLRAGSKKVQTDGPNWMPHFAGSSKSHQDISISCQFLKFLSQVNTTTGFKW